MRKYDYFWVAIFVVIIVCGVIAINSFFDDDGLIGCTEDARICPDGSAVVRVGPDCEFEKCSGYGDENYCDSDSRLADVCIEIYQPVCGWMDGSKIQCLAFPCVQTFSNSCFACMNENVLYWTEGECPVVG
jgi:hypothetical protein